MRSIYIINYIIEVNNNKAHSLFSQIADIQYNHLKFIIHFYLYSEQQHHRKQSQQYRYSSYIHRYFCMYHSEFILQSQFTTMQDSTYYIFSCRHISNIRLEMQDGLRNSFIIHSNKQEPPQTPSYFLFHTYCDNKSVYIHWRLLEKYSLQLEGFSL